MSIQKIKQNCRFDLIMIGVKGGFILYDLLRKLSTIVVNDIRTLDISDSKFKRNIANAMITFESCNANSTTVISELVAKKLHLKKGKYTILPLGGNIIECENKCFDNISLIYVGTFFNRNIEVTIEGLAMYLQRHPALETFLAEPSVHIYHGELDDVRRCTLDRGVDCCPFSKSTHGSVL